MLPGEADAAGPGPTLSVARLRPLLVLCYLELKGP